MVKPWITGSLMPSRRKMNGPSAQPMEPVINTSPAASDGIPPIFSATPMAMGDVTERGANDSTVSGAAPNKSAIPRVEATAVTIPAPQATNSGSSS